ncbi:MAG TPA: DegV family protein [Nocardioidaceae bacterium]|nr:DegV family protein [Nocardioidaceae bacterium]
MPSRVAVVTDSTAMLSSDVVESRGITVVPLQVVVGARSYEESTDSDPDMVADALRAREPVSTSRPAPEAFRAVYDALARDGAGAIVSVHLSGEISGTCESAELAARDAPVPVQVVDSRLVGVGTGFAVLAAAGAVADGADAEGAAEAARRRAAATTSLFYVDTLEYLRRGGRIGAAASLLGSVLAVKPLLQLEDGRVVPLEKVRTTNRALSRLEELAVQAAADQQVDIAVAHLANPERALGVAEHLRERVPRVCDVQVGEVGAVVGAHVGPGMVAVVVAPRV